MRQRNVDRLDRLAEMPEGWLQPMHERGRKLTRAAERACRDLLPDLPDDDLSYIYLTPDGGLQIERDGGEQWVISPEGVVQ